MYCGYELSAKCTTRAEDRDCSQCSEFDVLLYSNANYNECFELGKKHLEWLKRIVMQAVSDDAVSPRVLSNGVLDGDAIARSWFPTTEYAGQTWFHIFLSHSHLDEDKAIALAGLFAKHGINVFIDSCVWGYFTRLLKILDDVYCPHIGSCYDYDEHNAIMSHVFSMLSTALIRMIDATECIIFLNTSNSVKMDSILGQATLSPWIYQEIQATKLIRHRDKGEQRQLIKSLRESRECLFSTMQVQYGIQTSHLNKITCETIAKWSYAVGDLTGQDALDKLYAIAGVK